MKTKTYYFEKNGMYYKQYVNYSEKLGIWIPQNPRKISKEDYLKENK